MNNNEDNNLKNIAKGIMQLEIQVPRKKRELVEWLDKNYTNVAESNWFISYVLRKLYAKALFSAFKMYKAFYNLLVFICSAYIVMYLYIKATTSVGTEFVLGVCLLCAGISLISAVCAFSKSYTVKKVIDDAVVGRHFIKKDVKKQFGYLDFIPREDLMKLYCTYYSFLKLQSEHEHKDKQETA